MAYDVLIKNAKIIDGAGTPAFVGSVALAGSKIAAVGDVTGSARQIIDADGLTLAPGFIDPHTHYDAQLSWDRLVTPSCWHGVTTALIGNCSVGVAPCRRERHSREQLSWLLSNIESLSMDLLLNCVSWNWESFPEYMEASVRDGLALNPAFLLPLSAVRMYVMGEAAHERAANARETAEIGRLVEQALRAGAIGVSVNLYEGHQGQGGKPNGSYFTGADEFKVIGKAYRALGRGITEVAYRLDIPGWTDEGARQLSLIAESTARPVIVPGMLHFPHFNSDWMDAYLRRMKEFEAQGHKIVIQTSIRPFVTYQTFRQPAQWAELPCIAERVINKPAEAQVEAYRSHEFRQLFREQQKTSGMVREQWDRISIATVQKSENKRFVGLTVLDLAEMEGKDPVDALFDLAVDEHAELAFLNAVINANPADIEKTILAPGTQIGQSDAGAHIGQFCNAAYATYLIHEWVNTRKVLSLEDAVRRVTSENADLLGLRSKGRIMEGKDADLVLFDAHEVRPLRVEMVHDLPNGEHRFIERAQGVAQVLVGGQVTFKDGVHQGPLPGTIARPGA